MRKSQLYWICQVTGWSLFIIINLLYFGLSSDSSSREFLMFFLVLPIGIAITHLYRSLVMRWRLISAAIPVQLGAIVLFSVLKALAFFVVWMLLVRLLRLPLAEMTTEDISFYVVNFSFIFLLWNMLYYGFQYFENYRRSEINALRHLAASRESELNNLKAQLNPHFIFNCMNSIRALIDENPANAKAAVTMLSNILRNTLLIDKSKEIRLSEELKLVRDYLDLEKIRFEERLSYRIEADELVQNCFVPPFIVQSQVENAVKHGISRLPGKGMVKVEARKDNDTLLIKVSNTGNINSQQPLTGVGFMNSIQRLELLYGKQGQISIEELGDMVVVDINIPTKKYESNHH